MFLSIILLILGFIVLIKGTDFFVDGASSTAQNFKVSKMLIGLTIIAFGTSAPEFAVSMSALAKGNSDMVIGNIIGSCILNILFILGIAAVIRPIKVQENTIKKELPLCLMISTALAILFFDQKLANAAINQITRADAFIILLFFSIFLYYLFSLAKNKKEELENPPFSIKKSIFLVIFGLIAIFLGSELVVQNASKIATSLGLSERVISLTIIAFGTSLPELITTIVSSKKGEQSLLLGNIIGSNIFNICIVLGIPIAIYGTVTPASFQIIDLILLFGSSLLLCIFATTKKTITRLEGGLMLLAFFLYYITLFIS